MNKIINLYPLLFCCGVVTAPMQGQENFLSDFKIKWQNAMEYTIEFARAMPEDNYSFTPTSVEMTFREQLRHIAGNMVWLSSTYLGGSKEHIDPTKSGDSKKEIIAMLEKSFAYASQTIHGLTEHKLNEKVDFLAGRMTKRRIVMLLSDHVTHHRGQLVVYLRLKNVEPPDYRGW